MLGSVNPYAPILKYSDSVSCTTNQQNWNYNTLAQWDELNSRKKYYLLQADLYSGSQA